jgi:hypothetical protein
MSSTIRIQPHVRAVIDNDGAVLLDLKRGRYFSLNSMGVCVWRRLENGVTPAGIEGELARHYSDSQQVKQDVAVFIDSLRRAELINAI